MNTSFTIIFLDPSFFLPLFVLAQLASLWPRVPFTPVQSAVAYLVENHPFNHRYNLSSTSNRPHSDLSIQLFRHTIFMARPHTPPILTQLRSARTLIEQTTSLRALKNEIVGHVQKKEQWVGLGVLDPIVRTLAAAQSPARSNGKDARLPLAQRPLSDDEKVRLQALQLLASFANGMTQLWCECVLQG